MLFLKLLLMVISTFFIAMDFDRLTDFCMRQLDAKGTELFQQVKQYIVGTLFVCIRSYALIMSITFGELLIGFTILDIDPALILALCIAIFDILPVLGIGRHHDPVGGDHCASWRLYNGAPNYSYCTL